MKYRMIFRKLALYRQVMPAISDQFVTYTLEGDPQHLTKIQDVRHVVSTPFQDPPTDDRHSYSSRCTLLMLQDIRRDLGVAEWNRFEVQCHKQ